MILILAGEETGGMRIGYVQISDSEIKEIEIEFENSTKDTILAGLQNSPLPANSLPEDWHKLNELYLIYSSASYDK